MKQFKLIAFDIDGTILNKEHEVCYKLQEIVQYLKSKNYYLTLVTARLPISALAIAKDLGLDETDSVITLNGSFITNYYHAKLYSQLFDSKILEFELSQINEAITINYYNGFDWAINQFTFDIEYEQKFLKEIYNPKIGKLDFVNKITLMGENQHLLEARELLSKNTSLNLAFSHPRYLEVTTNAISKYHGLKYYANTLDINETEIVAFGDGENDIPMLHNVGLGVAMDNASDLVKQYAKDTAGHHLEMGVAKYLENMINNNLL